MRILRASHLGMCFGVRDAIALARQQATLHPLSILGDLVHNDTVVRQLQAQGIRMVKQPDQLMTAAVMITAHGASQRTVQNVRAAGHQVTEATCPLVHYAHRAVAALVRDGFHPVIIGKRDHVEVRGMTGDLDEYDVVLTEEDVHALRERPRFGVAAQTTQPIDRVRSLVALIRQRFPNAEVRFADTVCHPTKQRQSAALHLARLSDVVVVVGGAESNNTRELTATCRLHCGRVYQVQTAEDLQPDWFVHAETVGITAGTSTPDETINAVERRLRELAAGKPEAETGWVDAPVARGQYAMEGELAAK